MPRKIALLILLISSASCMEMRETVERMVMVRTTGSDLQPAATGYIYKKESDGPASVIKIGESEVMEHLLKLYKEPQSYEAPLPVADGPFNAKEDENKAASHASEAYVKPVVEHTDESGKDDLIDGIADDDFRKIIGKYADNYGDYKGDYKGDFADYLHSLGYYGGGVYNEKGGGSDYGLKGHHEYGEKGNKGYKGSDHFSKGGAGDYDKEHQKGYYVSEKGGHSKHYDEADAYGKGYALGHGYKGGEHGHKSSNSKGEEIDGFHKIYDKNEFKKDHDFYDGDALKGSHHKFGNGYGYHGADAAGYEKGGSHDSGHHEGGFGKESHKEDESGDKFGAGHSFEAGKDSYYHGAGDFGAKGEKYGGKGYEYAVEH